MSEHGGTTIAEAITKSAGPAICAYLTAGYPDRESFADILLSVATEADLVEVGVPFTDPMADGHTIQHASRIALEGGVTLEWILDLLSAESDDIEAPYLLMGYYNPFFSHGLDRLAGSLVSAGVSGVIVPDLPYEESAPMRSSLEPHGLAMVQLVTPTTPEDRLATLAGASGGFVYAVTMTGVTGGRLTLGPAELDYLQRVREVSPVPVLAGFGVRSHQDVAVLGAEVDGVIVGSALLEAIDRGDDPDEFIRSLRPVEVGA